MKAALWMTMKSRIRLSAPGKARSGPWSSLSGLTSQRLDDDAADKLIVVVLPSELFGVSLWGAMGDAEMVEVIFEIDPKTAIVSVSNQCT